MVMHARKLPRISDGFSEKHQAHGYENAKFSSKYRFSNHDKNRDSPSSNSLRSSSPDSRSQSPRYHKVSSGSYYKDRVKGPDRENRDRDRERERDYRDYRDREESRSPKDRRRDTRDRERERDRDHRDSRGNHVRLNSMIKKEEKERLMRVGEWSEHLSSCGKKYYYNCETEVSQWEKPTQWIEWERNHRNPQNHNKVSSIIRGHHDKSRQDKHSNLVESYRDVRDGDRERPDRRDMYRNDDHYDRRENHTRKYTIDGNSSNDTRMNSDSQDRNMSSHLPATSSSHALYSQRSVNCNLGPLPACLPSALPGSNNTVNSNNSSANHVSSSSSSSTNHVTSLSNSVLPAVPQLLNSHPHLLALNKGSGDQDTNKNSVNSNNNAHQLSHHDGECLPMLKNQLEPLTIPTNCNSNGPPTPTHSENQDCLDIRKGGSPTNSLNCLQSLSQTAGSSLSSIKANVPALTPSLANYHNENLISHVQGWPADTLEKQSQRLTEEAHTTGNLIMTKVSADLKMARSLVRLAEIQATLHEQRILFLRAQKKELEEVKSQNSYMSDT